MDIKEHIKDERSRLNLVPKTEVLRVLNEKCCEMEKIGDGDGDGDGRIDISLKLLRKAIDDITLCEDESTLIRCISNWSSATIAQSDESMNFFMNSLGSIIIRVDLGS